MYQETKNITKVVMESIKDEMLNKVNNQGLGSDKDLNVLKNNFFKLESNVKNIVNSVVTNIKNILLSKAIEQYYIKKNGEGYYNISNAIFVEMKKFDFSIDLMGEFFEDFNTGKYNLSIKKDKDNQIQAYESIIEETYKHRNGKKVVENEEYIENNLLVKYASLLNQPEQKRA